MSEPSKGPDSPSKAINLSDYVDLRKRLDGILTLLDCYRKGTKVGVDVSLCRDRLARLIVRFCQDRAVQDLLQLSDEQVREIADGAELPDPLLDILEERHRKFRKNITAYL